MLNVNASDSHWNGFGQHVLHGEYSLPCGQPGLQIYSPHADYTQCSSYTSAILSPQALATYHTTCHSHMAPASHSHMPPNSKAPRVLWRGYMLWRCFFARSISHHVTFCGCSAAVSNVCGEDRACSESCGVNR